MAQFQTSVTVLAGEILSWPSSTSYFLIALHDGVFGGHFVASVGTLSRLFS